MVATHRTVIGSEDPVLGVMLVGEVLVSRGIACICLQQYVADTQHARWAQYPTDLVNECTLPLIRRYARQYREQQHDIEGAVGMREMWRVVQDLYVSIRHFQTCASNERWCDVDACEVNPAVFVQHRQGATVSASDVEYATLAIYIVEPFRV